jgi:hypothetical protein
MKNSRTEEDNLSMTNRNSDDIVVYKSDDYEEHTFGYSDKFWKSRKLFRYNDYQGVVDYIYSIMLGE